MLGLWAWTGFMFLILCLLLATDLGRLVTNLVASLGSDQPPADPERRLTLSRILGGGVALVAGGMGLVAVRSGLSELVTREVRVTLSRLPPALDGTTIAQITDLHVGPTIRKEFVELVVNKTGAQSISIIAHSMGNQPTLQVLRDLRRSAPGNVRISQVILAAPDVDRDNFVNIARDIQGLASGVTLYAAGNDRALTVSRNFYGGIPRAGDVPTTGPLVLPGIDTIDVSAASMDSLGLNHSGYAENNALLQDIAALIATGMRPPKLRTPTLEEILTDHGAYWRYPAVRP